MLQFDLQFYEELTVARVKTVKFISGAFFLADRSACFSSPRPPTCSTSICQMMILVSLGWGKKRLEEEAIGFLNKNE